MASDCASCPAGGNRHWIEIPFPSCLAVFFCPVMKLPEVIQVCLAKTAADSHQAEMNVTVLRAWEDFQQVAPQVLPCRATDAMRSPDFSQRVDPGIPPGDSLGHPAEQVLIIPKRGLKRRAVG